VPSASSPSRPLLVLATLNAGKARELTVLLGDLPFKVRALGEFPGAALPEESEDSYRGNALLKARAAARVGRAWALADDSGLEVDALGGAPGVRSARYGGPGLDDAGRCALLLEALAGDLVKIRLFIPWSEQAQVFSLEGHRWPLEPGRQGSNLLSSILVGGMEALTLILTDGAGGSGRLPGDYLYADHREPYREAGLWGIFRVHDAHATTARLRPLR
jgi:hypothetical protein